MRASWVFVLCALTVLPAAAEPELKGSPSELAEYLVRVPKTVLIGGESEIKAPADDAVITLRVRTENKTLVEALRQNQFIRSKIIGFLGEQGLPLDRFQSAKFSSTPKYGVFGDKAKSYQVENIVRISVRDEKEFQLVAETADRWPEVHYEALQFEHTSKEALKLKALKQALDNADARRKLYETNFGARLTPVRLFEHAAPVPVERVRRAGAEYESSKSPYVAGLPSRAPEVVRTDVAETMSAFGELVFKAQVTVEYTFETR